MAIKNIFIANRGDIARWVISAVFPAVFLLLWAATSLAMTYPPPHMIKLRQGYKLAISKPNRAGYVSRKLSKRGRTIFLDTTGIEYTDWSAVYPLALHFDQDHDEILLVTGVGRELAGVIRLLVKGESVMSIDTLPFFIRGASDLGSDGKARFAGTWEFDEEWTDSLGIRRTTYNPILYYLLSGKGLKIDSAMTEAVNERIYGKFRGYDYIESYPLPVSDLQLYLKELKQIKHSRKISLNGF